MAWAGSCETTFWISRGAPHANPWLATDQQRLELLLGRTAKDEGGGWEASFEKMRTDDKDHPGCLGL